MASSMLQRHRWVHPVKLAASTTSKQTETPSLCLHWRGAQAELQVVDPQLLSSFGHHWSPGGATTLTRGMRMLMLIGSLSCGVASLRSEEHISDGGAALPAELRH